MAEILHDLSPAKLITAIEENLYERWAAFGLTPGTEVDEGADHLSLITGVPHAVCNGVFRARFTDDGVDEAIIRALEPFRSRGLPMVWWTGPSDEPADLTSRLQSRGLVSVEDSPGMAVDLEKIDAPRLAEGTTIEAVLSMSTLGEWMVPFLGAFDLPRAVGGFFWDALCAAGLEPDLPTRHYLGRWRGEPVACASVSLYAGVAGIYNVGTLPSARGRGLGVALTAAALHDARAEGYRVGVLHATEAALGLYRRLGFREHCKIGHYLLEAR